MLLHFRRHRDHSYSPMSNWPIRCVTKKFKLDEIQQAKLLSVQNSLAASKSYLSTIENERQAMMEEVFYKDFFNRDAVLHLMNVPHLAFE